jgi:hypothetical protein
MARLKLSRREQALIALAATLAFAAGAYFFLVKPLSDRRDLLQHDLAQAEALLSRYESVQAEKEEIVAKYRALGKVAARPQAYESPVDMMSDIQQLSMGLAEVTSMRPVGDGPSAGNAFGVEFDCGGQLEEIIKLLYLIEKERGTMSVVTLSVNTTSEPKTVRAHVYVEAEE